MDFLEISQKHLRALIYFGLKPANKKWRGPTFFLKDLERMKVLIQAYYPSEEEEEEE